MGDALHPCHSRSGIFMTTFSNFWFWFLDDRLTPLLIWCLSLLFVFLFFLKIHFLALTEALGYMLKLLTYLESMNSVMTVVMMTMPHIIPRMKRSQEVLKLCVFSSITLEHAFIKKIQKRALLNLAGQLNLLTSVLETSLTGVRIY